MSLRTAIFSLACAAALAAPFAATAQPYGDYYHRDYDDDRGGFRGYPQFARESDHINREIREGLDEGWLSPEQANWFHKQMEYVWYRETHEFRDHGWQLPPGDDQEIHTMLDNIDRSVDRARDRGY